MRGYFRGLPVVVLGSGVLTFRSLVHMPNDLTGYKESRVSESVVWGTYGFFFKGTLNIRCQYDGSKRTIILKLILAPVLYKGPY